MKDERKLKDESSAIVTEDNKRLQEVLRNYRILYLDKDNFIRKLFNIESIRIYDKSLLKISKYGDNEFTRERNRLLRDGDFLTYKEQMDILKKRGIWSEENENRIDQLRHQADEFIEEKDALLTKLDNGDQSVKKRLNKIKDEIVKIHNELLELLGFQVNFFRDTIEMRAQIKQQMGWMVSAVCRNDGEDKYNENKRLFKSVEDLEEHLNESDFVSLLNECNSYWSLMEGKQESFFAESPEELILESDGKRAKS